MVRERQLDGHYRLAGCLGGSLDMAGKAAGTACRSFRLCRPARYLEPLRLLSASVQYLRRAPLPAPPGNRGLTLFALFQLRRRSAWARPFSTKTAGLEGGWS